LQTLVGLTQTLSESKSTSNLSRATSSTDQTLRPCSISLSMHSICTKNTMAMRCSSGSEFLKSIMPMSPCLKSMWSFLEPLPLWVAFWHPVFSLPITKSLKRPNKKVCPTESSLRAIEPCLIQKSFLYRENRHRERVEDTGCL
jgi:hypothetical protein